MTTTCTIPYLCAHPSGRPEKPRTPTPQSHHEPTRDLHVYTYVRSNPSSNLPLLDISHLSSISAQLTTILPEFMPLLLLLRLRRSPTIQPMLSAPVRRPEEKKITHHLRARKARMNPPFHS